MTNRKGCRSESVFFPLLVPCAHHCAYTASKQCTILSSSLDFVYFCWWFEYISATKIWILKFYFEIKVHLMTQNQISMLWIYLEKVSYICVKVKNVAVDIKTPFQNSFDFCRFLLYTRKLNISLQKEALKLWTIKKEILLTIKQDIIHTILVNASIEY